jgi:hypothetical protein
MKHIFKCKVAFFLGLLFLCGIFFSSNIPFAYSQVEENYFGIWDSYYGEINFKPSPESSMLGIEGDYNRGENGKIYLQFIVNAPNGGGDIFNGVWVEDSSNETCESKNPHDGRQNWGKIELIFLGDRFEGKWGYCDGPLEYTGWTGRKITKGTLNFIVYDGLGNPVHPFILVHGIENDDWPIVYEGRNSSWEFIPGSYRASVTNFSPPEDNHHYFGLYLESRSVEDLKAGEKRDIEWRTGRVLFKTYDFFGKELNSTIHVYNKFDSRPRSRGKEGVNIPFDVEPNKGFYFWVFDTNLYPSKVSIDKEIVPTKENVISVGGPKRLGLIEIKALYPADSNAYLGKVYIGKESDEKPRDILNSPYKREPSFAYNVFPGIYNMRLVFYNLDKPNEEGIEVFISNIQVKKGEKISKEVQAPLM